MPINHELASKQWERYVHCRETGHIDFINKATKCDNYFAGNQWNPIDIARLREVRRPGLTINKVLGTLSSILGEQIDLRSEIAYKARYGAPSGNADMLSKVFRYISDSNQLDWVRSELFADGAITSRGFIDVRMSFEKSVTGDVIFTNLNPKNVIPDPDASEYDPDQWKDVITTRWLTTNDIAIFYNKQDAERIKAASGSKWAHGYDSIDSMHDRFGGSQTLSNMSEDLDDTSRIVRIIDRQYRKLSKMKFFINVKTGDRKRVPDSWDDNRISQFVATSQGAIVVDESVGERIRWTVTADEFVLFDEWSPYKHFTIIPYFPYLRYGRTIGLVENLIDPQDLLNKTTSQELHVVNTMANSGWKVKTGSLKNMTMDELEERGAQTGLVLELGDVKDADKIQPNQIPQGLDRLSVKGENYIKTVSMRGDAQMGMARADASADQIEANKLSSDVGLRKPMDNLKRTDFIIARNVLDLVQEFYTDPRIMTITHNALTGEQQEVKINFPNIDSGEIDFDVTLGEYDITVISQPAKQTLEQSQFEQGAYLREKLGIPIPDEFLIENSNLINKTGILQKMKENKESPEAQMQEKIRLLGEQLQVAQLKAEVSKDETQALHSRAKAMREVAETQKLSGGDPEKQQEMELEAQKHEQEMKQMREKHQLEMQIEREKAQAKAEEQRMLAVEKARLMKAQAIMAMKKQNNGQANDETAQRAA